MENKNYSYGDKKEPEPPKQDNSEPKIDSSSPRPESYNPGQDRRTSYQPRQGAYQPREGGGGYQPREGSGGYQPRQGGYQPREGGGYQQRDNNGGGYQRNDFRRPGGKPKPKTREKTETQDFLAYGEEKIATHFPVPVNATLPVFQRSVGMAEGTILEVNEKGNGVIEIDGFKYPMKENRSPLIQKRYPLKKYVGKLIKFSFYPTITTKGIKILGLKPESPPFIKISNFRRELAKQGLIEVLGTIKEIKPEYFMVSIWSPSSRKEYVVVIFGECPAKTGDFAKIDAILKDGLIRLEATQILTKKN